MIDEKIFTERGFTNIEQMATMFDYYKKEDERLNNIINSIETRLIEMGVDEEMLNVCEMYDVNGIELRKMIKELKGSDKE